MYENSMLVNISVDDWNIKNVTNMAYCFAQCTSFDMEAERMIQRRLKLDKICLGIKTKM